MTPPQEFINRVNDMQTWKDNALDKAENAARWREDMATTRMIQGDLSAELMQEQAIETQQAVDAA